MVKKTLSEFESLEDRVDRYAGYFTFPVAAQQETQKAFVAELRRGLERHKKKPDADFNPAKCSFMMLDTCAQKLPTGKEKGVFYGVDVGGTNCRIVRVKLDGKGGSPKVSQVAASLRDSDKKLLDENTPTSELFDFIAEQLKTFMEKKGDLGQEAVDPNQPSGSAAKRFPVGLTFSFGISQKALQSAVVLKCAKELRTGMATSDPIIGADVCKKLAEAFERKGIPADVKAALNDTTGTLYGGFSAKPPELPPCSIGLIIGTGFNACYADPEAQSFGFKGFVINTECGGLNRKIPTTAIDADVDYSSAIRGHQPLEKMTSGLYIPEICRKAVVKVFRDEAPKLSWLKDSLTTEESATIFNDSDAENLRETEAVLKDCWQWDTTIMQRQHVKRLVDCIFSRSAAICAVAVAAMGQKTGCLEDGLTVAMDGSIYRKNEKFRTLMNEHLKSLLGKAGAAKVHFCLTDDASGVGAALLAAAHA